MSTNYQSSRDVPSDDLADRLDELADIIISQKRDMIDAEFTMRIPAECDRDADLVLAEAARRLREMPAESKGEDEFLPQPAEQQPSDYPDHPGWTGNAACITAMVLLERLDTDNDGRVEQIRALIGRIGADVDRLVEALLSREASSEDRWLDGYYEGFKEANRLAYQSPGKRWLDQEPDVTQLVEALEKVMYCNEVGFLPENVHQAVSDALAAYRKQGGEL